MLTPLLPKIVLIKTQEKLRDQVFSIPGTIRYLFEQKKPAIVREKEIEQLKLITKNKRVIDHQVSSSVKGDVVDLTSYGFKNVKGTIDKVSNGVCWVKLESLGCTLKLTLK
jgi:transcription antitermination factor NusG